MAEERNFFLDILALVGGGRGEALSDLTPHLLGALFWGALCIFQYRTRKSEQSGSDSFLLGAFIFAFAIEAIEFVLAAALFQGIATNFLQGGLWPPLELALCTSSRLIIAAAFIQYLIRQRKTTVDFLTISLTIISLCYTYVAIRWWMTYQEIPDAKFDSQYYTWALYGGTVVMLVVAILQFLAHYHPNRKPVMAALVVLQVAFVLNILVSVDPAKYQSILNPIVGSIELGAIALFAYAALTLQVRSDKALAKDTHKSQRLESLGLLSSGIAHDFNNHLQIILGFTELAKVQAGEKNQSFSSLMRIEEAAEKAGALVNQLLAFSLGEAPKFETVDLNDTITKLTPLLTRLVGSEIKLAHNLDLSASPIKADGRMLEQIILNLVANAKDAITEQGVITLQTRTLPEIDIEVDSGLSGYRKTQLIVTDTGIGMDEKTASRIFEPFFTTKASGEGTGLGMATVYNAVQKHSGKIYARSEPGAYTQIFVDFPSVVHKSSKLVSVSDAIAERHNISVKGKGETILLAEDEVAIRELASTLMEASGYTVIVASNGQHAINIVNTFKGKIDLCLLDVAMPLLNGYQTYERIANARPGIRVLFITGNTTRVDPQTSVFPHLQKPFSKKTLLDSLTKALNDVKVN
jgi:signal transduction histidine kinase